MYYRSVGVHALRHCLLVSHIDIDSVDHGRLLTETEPRWPAWRQLQVVRIDTVSIPRPELKDCRTVPLGL